jgi:RNA polymerase sigma-70 factor (ECF subfamily)
VVALVDRAVATRDAEAFGALYDHHVNRVYRYLYVRAGSQPEAEDLTEQVFLRAWEAIDRFRWQGRPFIAWLYRLAHNVLVDHVRARRRSVTLAEEGQAAEVASESAAAVLAQRIDADMLNRALEELTVDQQQVILLKFIDGLTSGEIAQMLGKQEGAVRAIQLRALLSLRRVLERHGERGVR